jgi:hypothetical protein
MAVITNNISGSSSGGSRIAITGSVIISNAESFPQTGADTVFFVSGSESEKTVFGGAAKISGSLSTDGSVSLGDSADDAVTVAGDLTVNGGDLNTTSSTFNLLQSASILNIGTTPAPRAVNLGTADAIQAVTVGSIFGASSLMLEAGTGNMLLTGSTSTSYTIGGETGTGTITLGRSTSSNTINIGAAGNSGILTQTVNIASGAGRNYITIGSLSSTSAGFTFLRSGAGGFNLSGSGNFSLACAPSATYTFGPTDATGTMTFGRSTNSNTINIGSGGNNTANTQTINIGGGTGTTAVLLGATTGTSALTLQAGTGNVSITGATTTNYTVGSATGTGTITVGQSTASNTISVGSSGNNIANTQTINIGAGTGTSAIAIGSKLGTSPVLIQAGTSGLSISGSARFNQGLSGSLTQLTDGTSYLIAGTGISVATGSAGAVTIASTIGGVANDIIYRDSSNTVTGSYGLRYDGVSIKVNGNLESIYSSGDEGGEIFLNKPVTNTSITNGVTIDVYQNKLRIFENGGTSRGYYLDVTQGIPGVGTNLGTMTKTHTGYTNSEHVMYTFGFDTTSTSFTNANTIVTLAENQAIWIDALIVARQTAGSENRSVYQRQGLFYRTAGGSTTQQGSTNSPWTQESDANDDVQFAISSNDIRIEVKNGNSNNHSWVGTVRYQIVQTSS